MATIYKRKNPRGNFVYRVQIRKKNIPFFSLTFETAKKACDWVEKNEKEYITNPLKYIEWAYNHRLKMQRNRLLDA